MRTSPLTKLASATAVAAVLATGALAQKTIPPPVAPGACVDAGTRTYLMFPFATNQAGFDTGLSIANTASDPFGTTGPTASCVLTFYGNPGSPAPVPVVTSVIAPGANWTNIVSNIAPGFQGYIIASCEFPFAHGFAFVSDLGARNLAMGYLPTKVCSPRLAPD